MGIRPDRGHVKCARVVGEVMGRLHPHGDGAIYDALVRIVQPWAMRLPMVDGHGNFGSPGGDDSPAAMRYTECRMAPPAAVMTESIDEDTVDFRPNYDSREMEPSVLPSAIPNLVVNGASGIAVGMATNMAPHNLVEVVQALRHLIKHPGTDVDGLMRFIPGPDLPTGGKIVGLDGIRDAYETGRGTFRMRATARVETIGRRKGIVVTELPYGVGTEKVVERIKDLVQGKKLQGIADLKDLTDRSHGLRLVIEVKNGFVPEAVLEQLYRQTPMEDTFGINNVALVDGQPRTLGPQGDADGLPRPPLRRRTPALAVPPQQEGRAAAPRRRPADRAARHRRGHPGDPHQRRLGGREGRLMSVFDLSQAQADYILEMQLRRLTRFSRIELEKEQETLRREIEELEAILADEDLLKRVVSDELGEVAKTFGTPRRTVLLESAGTGAVDRGRGAARGRRRPLLRPALLHRAAGPHEQRRAARRGRRAGPTTTSSSPRCRTTARGEIGVLTSTGRVLRARRARPAGACPPSANEPNLQGGVPLSELLSLEHRRARARAVHAGHRRAGTRARDPRRAWSSGSTRGARQGRVGRHRLEDGDEVVGAVELRTGDEELCFVTSDAQLLHFPASLVRPQGRSGGGMAGVKLAAGERVVWFGALDRVDADGAVRGHRVRAPRPRSPAPSPARSR